MSWQEQARALADVTTHRYSRWQPPVATTPRHLFVPRWWERTTAGLWQLCDGPASGEKAWHRGAYRDTSLVTRVGTHHADHAEPGTRAEGRATSSATLPSLVVRMFQHARLDENEDLLDVGTGSGYGAALAARRLSSEQVTSVDVDPYLVQVARARLAQAGVAPTVETVDATGELPYEDGRFDRIVATVAVRTVPADWLRILCTGGRFVTTLAGTSLIVTGEKTADGGAVGRVEWDRAGFMHARNGEDYPPGVGELLAKAAEHDGDEVTLGPYPVVDVANAWDLASMLELTAPGIEHGYREADGKRIAVMAHPDGSWARAEAPDDQRPTVHQGGPRRLWDLLDECRAYWLQHGELPVRGAKVYVREDGATILARGSWHVKLLPEKPRPSPAPDEGRPPARGFVIPES